MNNKNKSTTSVCGNKNTNNRNYKIINNSSHNSNNNDNSNNNNNNNNKMRIPETRKYWVDVLWGIVSSHGERNPL